MPEKIRPPSPKHIRDEGEADLPDLVRAPDPTGSRELDPDAISADAATAHAAAASGQPYIPLHGALTPAQAHQHRLDNASQQNRLGQPARMTDAEKLLKTYQETLAAYREDYATNNRSEAKREPYLKAREAMILAGLMTGDP